MKNVSVAPKEHDEQVALINWANIYLPEKLKPLLFAIPNGGTRTPRNGKTLKNEGVKRGIPDLFFAYPKGGYHGLFLEMKRRDPALSKVSQEQMQMMALLSIQNYDCKVCYGCLDAIEKLKDYLNQPEAQASDENLKKFAERESKCG